MQRQPDNGYRKKVHGKDFLLSAAYGDSDMAFELLQMNAPEVDWNKRLKENANEKTDIQQTQQKYQAFTKLLERVNYAISYAEFLESVKHRHSPCQSYHCFRMWILFLKKIYRKPQKRMKR